MCCTGTEEQAPGCFIYFSNFFFILSVCYFKASQHLIFSPFHMMTLCPFFLLPLLPDLRSVDLNWKMTWFSSATSSLLHKNQHASSREIWTCLLLFLSFSLPLCLTLFQCCLFYLSAVKASQALLSFVVRNLYLPKGGISDGHRQPLSSPFCRKQCFPLPPEETAPLLSLSLPHPFLTSAKLPLSHRTLLHPAGSLHTSSLPW